MNDDPGRSQSTRGGERWLLGVVVAFSAVSLVVWGGVAMAFVGGGDEAPTSGTQVADSALPDFDERAAELGFRYDYVRTGYAGMRDLVTNAGVYVTDFDNDGRSDLLAVGGEEPVLFENEGGTFSPSGALPDLNSTTNAALFFDFDNDGWDDLLLLRARETPLFLENRNGSFRVRDVGFDRRLQNPTGASAADYDLDGCLDVFVYQNGDWANRTPLGLQHDSVTFIEDDNGNPNYLYEGNCSGFDRVADAGIHGTTWTLAASFVDLTGDGYPDVHVGNDYNADFLYVNRGNGTFRRTRLPHSSRNAMSSTVFDVNGDGRLDLFVSNVYYEEELKGAVPTLPVRGGGNNLFVNRGNGTFVDRAEAYGVRKGGWGWAAVAADFDNDGERSLFHATTPMGGVIALQRMLDASRGEVLRRYPFLEYPMFFERTGPKTFETAYPPSIGLEGGSGRGVATLDANGDGVPDLVVAQTRTTTEDGASYDLYVNERRTANAWLDVRVEPGAGTPALGARVIVRTDRGRIERRLSPEVHYLSQSSRVVHVGLGNASEVRSVRVVWPGGPTRTFTRVPVNESVRVEPSGELTVIGE